MTLFFGSCLCKNIAYEVKGDPILPHLCSCHMCQKWSGAFTVAWVNFPRDTFLWTGSGGEPSFYRSSEKTQRGFCPKCGGTLCALDDGASTLALTMASLDEPERIVPSAQHSYKEESPGWWHVSIVGSVV